MSIERFAATALLAIFIATGSAHAQQVRLACGQGLVQNQEPGLIRSALTRAAAEADRIPIRFIGHATFLIRSPQGVNVVTDYNDNYRADVLPDIATMNTNRANHRTFQIEPSIAHALLGWDAGLGIRRHDVTYKDVRVYSEPTNVFPMGTRYTNDTSIFVIQVGGICIAHFGHTAHTLDDETVHNLGRIDVALTPVDRVVTQSYEEMFHNIRLIKPRIVIPMHDIGWTTQQFLTEASRYFPSRRDLGDTIELSRDILPRDTEIWEMLPRSRSGSY